MAESGNKSELGSKFKFSSFFNRSLTMHSTPKTQPSPLPRAASISKFYNSYESVKGKVKKLATLFDSPESVRDETNELQVQSQSKLKSFKSMGPLSSLSSSSNNHSLIRMPGTEDRIVVFLTSLRGIRRTYEDCYAVMTIFKGFRVWVDERDISMDSAYKLELQSVLGEKNASLPQVFIRGKHVGGADAIKQMFETGELAKVLKGFPVKKPGYVCEACGDVRFVPCGNCSGSRKVFDEDEGVLKRCWECNENGLSRCPDCCY